MAGFKKLEDLARHPRPDFARADWTPLDGEWKFALDPGNRGLRRRWYKKGDFKKKINVPFCVESDASGIAAKRGARRMWYARRFPADPSRRMLLHFGAADYRAVVWLNGRLVGEHEGGYTPFSFDLSGYLEKDNLLVVRVSDSDDLRIPRGKQTILGRPLLVHYTPVSGLWQPVWLETTGAAYLKALATDANPKTGRAVFRCALGGDDGDYTVRITVKGPSAASERTASRTASREAAVSSGKGNAAITMDFDEVEFWSPARPALYRLKVEILRGKKVEDAVESYFGWRAIEISDGKILLDGKPFYQRLVLNQGYFPGGWYTPVSADEFKKDVELIRNMGFNGMRIHQKVEDPRFLFWCDVLGLAVWEEMPSGYFWSARLRRAIRGQWREAITRDRNHPCILFWVPFNESWGIHPIIVSSTARKFVREIVGLTKELDPTRPVIDNSGFEHVETDIVDIHHYMKTAELADEFYERIRDPEALRFRASNLIRRFLIGAEAVATLAPTVRYEGQPIIISEYGGFGFYRAGGGKSLVENFSDYTLGIARQPHLQGYAYTQFTDVEQEKNGLLTLDREPKVPIEEIRKVNEEAARIVKKKEKDHLSNK
ncbi:MAG: glycoside hydrolase family 2 TIM barrel-domain containing protein [bacterium]